MAAEIALPHGYALHEYRVEQTLGIGGFGLTYLATDSNLNLKVAIKEYLPGDLAQRGEDQSVQPKSESSSESFNWGLSRFLDESRTLASFRHPNIVRVLRFFEANRTAYMVMEFVAGQPLGEWTRTRRPLEQGAVLAIAGPLLDGLELIHRTGYLHRDIKPGNVFIREDGSPVLLDFGSARTASSGTERTAIVTPGYAPIEQYHSQGRQGPWSDLYAFGGVLYWMIIGKRPVEAVARVRQDMLPPAVQLADRSRYSIELLTAVDWALVSHEEQRPQSVAEFRSALSGLAAPDPRTVTYQTTVKMQDPLQATTPPTTFPTGVEFDREALKKIEAELARYIGAVARVVVKRAAVKARDAGELYLLIAEEIEDKDERNAFVRKAISASGKE